MDLGSLNEAQIAAIKGAAEGAQLKIGGSLYTKQGQQLVPATPPSAPAAAPTPTGPTRGWATEALPIGGAILGGTFGGIPGAALGAGIGEEAAQLTEMARGKRTAADVPKILRTGAEQGAMEAVGAPIARGIGRMLKTGATKIGEAVLPRSMQEARYVQNFRAATPITKRMASAVTGEPAGPRTLAQTVTEQGLAGTEAGLGIGAKRTMQNLWTGSIEPALTNSPERVNMHQFFDDLTQKIAQENPELARQADLVEAIDSLREAYQGVGDVSLRQLQDFKRGWAKFVPQKAYRGKEIAGALNDVKNEAADLARSKIYEALGPDVRQSYLDYGNLTELAEHGKRAMTGGKLRGGFGGFWSAIKDMALTPTGTLGAQVVYKLGQGVTLIGKPGARFVRDIIAGAPEVGQPTQTTLNDIFQKQPAQAQPQP